MESRVVKIFMRLQKGKSITRADIVEIGRDARKAGAIVAQSGPDPTTPDQNDFIAGMAILEAYGFEFEPPEKGQ
jgi:hypothetical protein